MRTCGIVKFLAAFLLIIPPVVIGNGFKDYQLKIGYGIGELRVLKWLNRIIRLDRASDTPEVPLFPPIKVHDKPLEIHSPNPIENQTPFIPSPPNNPPEPVNNIQTLPQIAPQVLENVNQSPSQDSSSKSSSADSTEAPPPAGPSHSFTDYLHMKWFHGSPNATYFNEHPVPDKLLPVIDSKTNQETNPSAGAAAHPEVNFATEEQQQQPTLLSIISDSILSRMFSTIKRMTVPKIQKQDIRPLKFYDEPPKPQPLIPVPPKAVHFPSPYNPPLSAAPNQIDPAHGSAQPLGSHLVANNPSVPTFDPANSKSPAQQEEPEKIVSESDKTLTATTFNPLLLQAYGLSEAPEESSTSLPELAYDPADNQPAEQSFSVPDNSNSQQQPQTTINAVERIYVPLQTAYSPKKRQTIDNPSGQLDEPDNSALLLAFKPQIPTYA